MSYHLAMRDRERFKNTFGVKENAVPTATYSNSSQPPIDAVNDPFALLDHQDVFRTKYTDGTVLHFWLGERIDDPGVVKRFVKSVCEGYHLPYFTLTPTFSICPDHGYIAGDHVTSRDLSELWKRSGGLFPGGGGFETGETVERRQEARVFETSALERATEMIADLYPCSFIDFPGELSAVIFTQGCDLRAGIVITPSFVQRAGGEEWRQRALSVSHCPFPREPEKQADRGDGHRRRADSITS